MRCEYCGRKIYGHEVVHGFRFGSVDEALNAFIPAKESATTVICDPCGKKVYRIIYSVLNPKPIRPTYLRTFSQSR